MLRVTVEIWPGGRESVRREIATADIGRTRDDAAADYEVELRETFVGIVGKRATVEAYPRWSASIWDLVARAISVALNGGDENLPSRPSQVVVPIHDDGRKFVKLEELPEPARTIFAHKIRYSSVPLPGCAYVHDWLDFLAGVR